jgi:hypothetical protein
MPEQTLAKIVKHYTAWLPYVLHHAAAIAAIVLTAGVVIMLLRFALRLWDWRQLLRQKYVCIEITPPITADKTPLQTSEWIARLHGIGSSRTMQEKLQRVLFSLSLELPSTRQEGIRYYVRVPEQEARITEQAIAALLTNARIRIIEDYLPRGLNYKTAQILEFKQRTAYYLPLNTQGSFKAHDPFTQLSNAMTGLSDREQIVVQLVLEPAVIKDAKIIEQRVKRNEDMLALSKQHSRSPVFKSTIGLVFKLLSGVVTFITDIVYSTPADNTQASGQLTHEHQVRTGVKPARSITSPEQDAHNTIHNKVTQKLFRAEVRALIVASDQQQARLRVKAMKAAMSAYDTEHQQLRAQWNSPAFILNRYRLFKFTHRLPSLFQHHANKLAPSEIADIYHFPTPGNAAESLVQSLSRTLPATLSQKRGTDVDVIVGRNIYQGQHTDIGLTAETRMKHTYVIGSTGTGKTTLLKSIIYQDMVNGKGLAVLDPHGDMFRELLQIVPEHRQKDVVIFDPSDRDYLIGLNIMSPGIHFTNEQDGYSWIASSVISVFSKLTDEAFWGPRMEHILRNATLTALHLPNPSLYTLQRLLTDKNYQRTAVKSLKDRVLKDFWLKEMLPLGDAQLATTVAPLTHRLGIFMTDTTARSILLQQHSTLRMSEIMDEGKILLVNLSKGDIGEDQSNYFGTILTSLIWMAAYQRTKIPEKKRRDFFLYIDEFQNFATPSFADITSEGRKFHIALTVSHQNVAQIKDQNVLKVMAGNSHTMICFRAGPGDETFMLPFMKPAIDKGDIINLAPHHFFIKTVADESELAFSGITVPLECTESPKLADRIISASRKRYATPRKDIEAYLDTLFSSRAPKEDASTNASTPPKDDP